VMERIHGLVPTDDPPYPKGGWVADLPAAERPKLYDGLLRALADVHAVDWRALDLGLPAPAEGTTSAAHELAELHRTYEWVHEGQPSPTIDAALAILADRLPPEEEVVLNWGDARIGNILFAADSLEVNALLDWEMATIASPELDLGWFLHMDRFFEEGMGLGKLDGFQSREELIARYEELTGRSVRHADFYEAFAATRNAILTMRIGRIMIEAGAVPPDSSMPMTNPASMFLATMLDVPSPGGESTYFMDNR
jgi:aminoglycoside phosphotransferase (APT) family kinase protein